MRGGVVALVICHVQLSMHVLLQVYCADTQLINCAVAKERFCSVFEHHTECSH